MPWKPALSLFLTTLRLKLLEDSSLDTAVDMGPGKDSDATDGKGEGVPILSLANAPFVLLHSLMFPVYQWYPIAAEFWDSFCMG